MPLDATGFNFKTNVFDGHSTDGGFKDPPDAPKGEPYEGGGGGLNRHQKALIEFYATTIGTLLSVHSLSFTAPALLQIILAGAVHLGFDAQQDSNRESFLPGEKHEYPFPSRWPYYSVMKKALISQACVLALPLFLHVRLAEHEPGPKLGHTIIEAFIEVAKNVSCDIANIYPDSGIRNLACRGRLAPVEAPRP